MAASVLARKSMSEKTEKQHVSKYITEKLPLCSSVQVGFSFCLRMEKPHYSITKNKKDKLQIDEFSSTTELHWEKG